MSHEAPGKHGWSVGLGMLLCVSAGSTVHAAPLNSPVQIAIGSPTPTSLVAGRISVSVAYSAGMLAKINAFTVYVDDQIQYSRTFLGMNPRGIQYLELDTRTLSDGNHTVKIAAVGSRGVLAIDAVDITVRNGVAGGPDLVPPLVQFKGLADGDTVSGRISLEVLAEDNVTFDPLVALFVNRQLQSLGNRAPVRIELDTAPYLDPNTGAGKILLEAWAVDKANNRGVARPITLNVRPFAPVNQTPRKDDPTAPVVSAPPAPEAVAPAPQALGPNEAAAPAPIPPKPRTVQPAARRHPLLKSAPKMPPAVRIAKSVPLIGSAPAPTAAPGAGAPAGSRASIPQTSRPASPRAVEGGAQLPSPSFAAREGYIIVPLRGAVRDAVPAAPPTTRMVRADLTGPDLPAAVRPVPSAGTHPQAGPSRISIPLTGRPEGTRAIPAEPDATMPMAVTPAPAAEPNVGGARASVPAVPAVKRAAPAPKPAAHRNDSIIMVVPRDAKPDQAGKLPVQVFHVRTEPSRTVRKSPRMARGSSPRPTIPPATLPVDRSYRLRPGDTLLGVAKRFRVTAKSLLVANGVTDSRRIRSGSIIKVPGTFDIVLNDRRVAFDVSPRVENGLAIAPFRQIFEHTGGVVVYYPDNHEVRAANEQQEVRLQVGSREAKVNGSVVVMDREAFIDSGRTLVPITFIEKAMDLKAEYDVKTGSILLLRK